MNRFKPKEYLRDDEILISSTIQLNCSLSNSMIRQWNIFRCEKDCLTFNQMKSLIEISLTEIEIPSELFPISGVAKGGLGRAKPYHRAVEPYHPIF